jgi:uncharacterized protein YbdZ (MbtH family)
MMQHTEEQYQQVVAAAREIALSKHQRYGASWRVMRPTSLADQMLIKARRIRRIEESRHQEIPDSPESELLGILNYAVLTLVQYETKPEAEAYIDEAQLTRWHQHYLDRALTLMRRKNSDYGEVWREMLPSSFTDLILAKLYRIREMLTGSHAPHEDEGVDANLYDIINYAVFALIKRGFV